MPARRSAMERADWGPLALCALVALAVQTATVVETSRQLVFRFPLLDSATYHRMATAMADDSWHSQAPFWQPPLYPALLSMLYRTIGSDMIPVRLAHGLTAAAAAVLAYAIGRRLGGKRIALAAGLATACYGPLAVFCGQLLPAGLGAALTSAAVLLGLRLLDRPTSWRRALLCGLGFGLAAVNIPNALVCVPVLAFLVWRRSGAPPAEGAAAARRAAVLGALAAGIAAAILPVTLRNFVVSGQWVPISTNGGINLFIGNNPDAVRTMAIRPGTDWDRLAALPFRRGGVRTEAEAQRWFIAEVARYAWNSPAAFTGGLARKALLVVNARELPRNIDPVGLASRGVVTRPLLWRAGPFSFPGSILLPLGLLGSWLALKRGGAAGFVAASWVAYAGSVAVFFPASRYMMPVAPLLAALAAVGAAALAEAWRLRVRARLAWMAGALLFLSAVAAAPVASPTDGVDFESELETNAGIALQTRGRVTEAAAQYLRVLKRAPGHAEAHFHLGTAYRDLKRFDEAMASHRRAIELRPDHLRAMNDLGVMLFEVRRTDESVLWLQRALEVDPDYLPAMKNLAVGLLAQGRLAEANSILRRAGLPEVAATRGEIHGRIPVTPQAVVEQ